MKKNILKFIFVFSLLISIQNFASNKTFLRANTLYENGKYTDAFLDYKRLLVSPKTNVRTLVSSLHKLTMCLRKSGKIYELDDILEKSLLFHSDKLLYVISVANLYMNLEHWGRLQNGTFLRGLSGSGNASSYMRDRVIALRLYDKALKLFEKGGDLNDKEIATFYKKFIDCILYQRGPVEIQRLLTLTNTKILPDYEFQEGFNYFDNEKVFAPVDLDFKNIYFQLRNTYNTCQNDGERWHYIINKYMLSNPKYKYDAMMQFAFFYYQLLGIQTLFSARDNLNSELIETIERKFGPLSLLKDNETITATATGINLLQIPNGFSYIKNFKNILANANSPLAKKSVKILTGIYLNRRQFSQAIEVLKQYQLRFKDSSDIQYLINSIDGQTNRFLETPIQALGNKMYLRYAYRNANSVHLKAYRINIRKFFSDMKLSFENSLEHLDMNKLILGNIERKLKDKEFCREYIEGKIADWTEKLNPETDYKLSYTKIYPPIKESGVYLFSAVFPSEQGASNSKGRELKTVLWYNNSVLVLNEFGDSYILYVTDALSGKPLKNCAIDILSIKKEEQQGGLWSGFQKKNIFKIHTKTKQTSKDGIVKFKKSEFKKNAQYMFFLNDKKYFAFLSFNNVRKYLNLTKNNNFPAKLSKNKMNQLSSEAFIITDSPFYHPGGLVNFNCVIKNNFNYNKNKNSEQKYNLIVNAPNGTTIFKKPFTLDKTYEFFDKFKLSDSAVSGKYSFRVSGLNTTGIFFVEDVFKHNFSIKEISRKISKDRVYTIGLKVFDSAGKIVANAPLVYRVYLSVPKIENYLDNPWGWLYGNQKNTNSLNLDLKEQDKNFKLQNLSLEPSLIMKNTVYTDQYGVAYIKVDTALDKLLFKGKTLQYDIIAELKLNALDKEYEHIKIKENSYDNLSIAINYDKNIFKPGETATISIKSNSLNDACALVFIRPASEVNAEYRLIHLKNGMGSFSVKIFPSDIPSFFIEAFSINNAKIFFDTKKILVPPVDNVLNVKISSKKFNSKIDKNINIEVEVINFKNQMIKNASVLLVASDAVTFKNEDHQSFDIRKVFFGSDFFHYSNNFISNLNGLKTFNIKPKMESAYCNLGAYSEVYNFFDCDAFNFYSSGMPLLKLPSQQRRGRPRPLNGNTDFPLFPSLVFRNKNFNDFTFCKKLNTANLDGKYLFIIPRPKKNINLKLRCYVVVPNNDSMSYGYKEILLNTTEYTEGTENFKIKNLK